jgi:hypothetical protein
MGTKGSLLQTNRVTIMSRFSGLTNSICVGTKIIVIKGAKSQRAGLIVP